MIDMKLSEKLARYLNKIQNETGREVQLEKTYDIGLSGGLAAFENHPSLIRVLIAADYHWTETELEKCIAHESTHGLLTYGMGYCSAVPKHALGKREKESAELLVSMIEDIVVNRIIHEQDFSPCNMKYLTEVEGETKAARRGKDYYNLMSDDPVFKDRFMVARYVLAWGYLEYFTLEPPARRVIKKFLKAVEKSYSEQYEMASQITELIRKNDIFTPDGYRKTLEGVLSLWGLKDLVKLEAPPSPTASAPGT